MMINIYIIKYNILYAIFLEQHKIHTMNKILQKSISTDFHTY